MTAASSRYDQNARFDIETIDTTYGDDLAARVYKPRGAGPFPALIDVHGGAWNFGSLTGGESVDVPLAETGLTVIAIDFHLAPDHPYPAQVSDLNHAIRWAKTNAAKFGIDLDGPLGVIGHSSGGQTAILSAMRPFDSRYAGDPVEGGDQTDATIGYVMTLYPVIDPHARYLYAKETGQDNLVTATEAYFLSEDAMREGNPQGALDRGETVEKPPLLILPGTADVNVPMSIPERFIESYRAAGGSVQMEPFEGAPHLFAAKPGPETDRAVGLMKAFVSEQMTAVASVRTNEMTSTLLPLSGVRVLDLTWHAAGPFATRLLADYGADVIKIERRETGDPSRGLPPFYKDEPGTERSGLFMFLNTNKRSVTLDLKSDRGRALILELARDADVVVESFAPGTMDALGLGYEALKAANPRVVLTSISNYGQTGPYRDWGGSDLTLYAMGGPMLNTGHADREPLKVAGRIPSYHVGATAASATAIALLAAEESGEGDHIDVSFFETWIGAIDRRTTNLLGFQYSGTVSTRPAVGQLLGSGIWPCLDGFFFTTLVPPRFAAMARMIGAEHIVDDPDWSTPAARANPDRVDEFAALAIGWFIERTRSEIRDEVDKFGIYGGPINSIEDFVTNEHFLAREFFQEIDHPTTGPITYPGYNFRITSEVSEKTQPEEPRRRAPLLGEHTDEVLGDLLDMDAGDIARLRERGAI